VSDSRALGLAVSSTRVSGQRPINASGQENVEEFITGGFTTSNAAVVVILPVIATLALSCKP
ncbi:hypothetical protein P692DRAFT_20837620, partial [Suillus brevipes Sb2]